MSSGFYDLAIECQEGVSHHQSVARCKDKTASAFFVSKDNDCL